MNALSPAAVASARGEQLDAHDGGVLPVAEHPGHLLGRLAHLLGRPRPTPARGPRRRSAAAWRPCARRATPPRARPARPGERRDPLAQPPVVAGPQGRSRSAAGSSAASVQGGSPTRASSWLEEVQVARRAERLPARAPSPSRAGRGSARRGGGVRARRQGPGGSSSTRSCSRPSATSASRAPPRLRAASHCRSSRTGSVVSRSRQRPVRRQRAPQPAAGHPQLVDAVVGHRVVRRSRGGAGSATCSTEPGVQHRSGGSVAVRLRQCGEGPRGARPGRCRSCAARCAGGCRWPRPAGRRRRRAGRGQHREPISSSRQDAWACRPAGVPSTKSSASSASVAPSSARSSGVVRTVRISATGPRSGRGSTEARCAPGSAGTGLVAEREVQLVVSVAGRDLEVPAGVVAAVAPSQRDAGATSDRSSVSR